MPITPEIRNIYAELGIQAGYDADVQDLDNIVFGRNFNGISFCIDLLRHISTKVADAKILSDIGPVISDQTKE